MPRTASLSQQGQNGRGTGYAKPATPLTKCLPPGDGYLFLLAPNRVRLAFIEVDPVEPLDHADNKQLLAKLAGDSIAEALMHQYGGLTNLAQASFDELQLVKGIGKSKAAAIKSAFLLAQRLMRESYAEAPLLDTPERVADLLREQNRIYTVENFQVVFLNTRRRLIGVETISQGTLDTILVHAREVFLPAIAKKASAIILAHNHPSGVMSHPVLHRMALRLAHFSQGQTTPDAA